MHIPPPPETMRSTPMAIAEAIEPYLERIMIGVEQRIGARLDRDAAILAARFAEADKKNAARHRLVLNRITDLEREFRTLDARVTALETTRIVLRGITSTVAKRSTAQKKRRRRAAKRR
jgi:hypothetical protein